MGKPLLTDEMIERAREVSITGPKMVDVMRRKLFGQTTEDFQGERPRRERSYRAPQMLFS